MNMEFFLSEYHYLKSVFLSDRKQRLSFASLVNAKGGIISWFAKGRPSFDSVSYSIF